MAIDLERDHMIRRITLVAVIFLASTCMAGELTYVAGVRNPSLAEGARHMLAGRDEKGIELTLLGLRAADGRREEEIALSNLCAGYTNLGDYETALKYCDLLLARNEKSWRAYNSKAFIYVDTKQYDKAESALIKGEAINPGATSMKIARALFLDATQPVVEEIEVDDRQKSIEQ